MALLQWIEGLHVVRLIATVPAIYPTISALHILGVGILLGSIVPVDLRLLRAADSKLDAAIPALIRLSLAGFVIAATAGILLASVRISDYTQNPAFLAKMAIVLTAGANAFVLHLSARRGKLVSLANLPKGRAAAFLSLILWLGALFAGRWIAFV
ncbi:DUF2214 domain-containing protein [Pelagibius sp. 7325]|uniref:DUF2214 domain-containing protein n=1 Tax=Pelagibius sp. 7325 TaxID=3131994 RepID=UPI0030EEB489